MSQKPFTIDAVSWHTQGPGAHADPERIRASFRRVVLFLQESGLTNRTLLAEGAEVKDGFELVSSDLTEEGMEFVRSQYPKWQRHFDRNGDLSATRLLEGELAKRRKKA